MTLLSSMDTNLTQTYLKSDSLIDRPVHHQPLYSINNSMERPIQKFTNRNTDNVPVSMFVDPIILNQLKTNPFSMPSYYPNT